MQGTYHSSTPGHVVKSIIIPVPKVSFDDPIHITIQNKKIPLTIVHHKNIIPALTEVFVFQFIPISQITLKHIIHYQKRSNTRRLLEMSLRQFGRLGMFEIVGCH